MTQQKRQAVFGDVTLTWGDDIVLHADADGDAGVPVPQPDLDTVLYWIVDAWGYSSAQQRQRGKGRAAAWWLGLFASMPLDFTMRLGGRRPYGSLNHITPIAVPAIDAAFDDLWTRCRVQMPDVLLAVRDAAALRARMSGDETARLLRFDRDGALLGYIALRREDDAAVGLNRFVITDMLVDETDPKIAQALFAAAYEYATAKQCHVLELPALPMRIAEMAWAQKPYVRKSDAPAPTMTIADAALKDALAAPEAWYLTAFDVGTL